MDLKITPSGQTIVKPTTLGPVANTDTKLLIYGLFQKGRVLAQDEVFTDVSNLRSPHSRRIVRTAQLPDQQRMAEAPARRTNAIAFSGNRCFRQSM